MQIALTKKIADAIGIKPGKGTLEANPLFCWTANWTNTFDRRKEDMVVLVNNATRFTVTIFGVKRNQFKEIESKMLTAIRNTLLAMNLNTEIVDEYMAKSGEITFVANQDRKLTAWVNRKGLDAAFVIGRAVNDSGGAIKYDDTLGHITSQRPAGYSGGNYSDGYIPAEKMIETLTELTGKPAYKYRAFELLVTLDLEIYKATRRLIVPADLKFTKLHKILQEVFDWKSYHLYDFAVFDGKSPEPAATLVPNEESLSYDDSAVLMADHRLSEYLPQYKYILYTYDMGDSWDHQIELMRVIDEHNEDSPYLMEAVGQAPPEDVGGVGGYIDFYSIMKDESHPDYAETKAWAGYWMPELREWQSRPKVIIV